MPKRKRSAATTFEPGGVPRIACLNLAETPLCVDLDRLIRALQKFVDHCLAPVWGTPAKLVKVNKVPRGAWVLVFLESADPRHAKALGYHKPFFNGHPIAKVFVKSTHANKEEISLVASHELAEMLVDPAGNLWCAGRNNVVYACEICDAVEEEKGFKIDGLAMSDFVYPAYYHAFRKRNSVQFDHLKRVTRPFQVLPGGYAKARKGGKVLTIFGSKAKKRRFLKEDRRQHRTEDQR
jgi:hypothetical protein